MKVLSLFDGISCTRLAFEKNGIKVDDYISSEIDKYAIAISKHNYPDNFHIGDIKDIWHDINTLDIDFVIGGSPCQDLSIAKRDRKGLKGERSGLFWDYVRVLNYITPFYFILENVASMPKKDKDIITETLGVEPVMIDASLVSAQSRKRLFWVGVMGENGYETVEIPQPKDREIYLKDILENGESDRLKSYCIDANYYKGSSYENYKKKGRRQLIFTGGVSKKDIVGDGKGLSRNFSQGDRVYSPEGKSATLSALGGGRGAKTGLYEIENKIRKLTPIECERLQGIPDDYTLVPHPVYKNKMMSNTQRYKALGNAFNVDVIAHILSFIK